MSEENIIERAAPAMLKALLEMRGFVEMFHGRLDEIDEALALAGHPQSPPEYLAYGDGGGGCASQGLA